VTNFNVESAFFSFPVEKGVFIGASSLICACAFRLNSNLVIYSPQLL